MNDVVVIGSGPAGIAAAVALEARGIRPLVLEQGDRPFAALRRLDPDLTLVTPARRSRLPRMRELDGAPRHLTVRAWLEHAERYRKRLAIEVRTGVRVTAVRAGDGALVVEHAGAVLQTRHVVDATGQLSWPRRPPGRGIHSLDVRESDLARARTLMIVGAGTSAIETLQTWVRVRAPGARAWVVRRSPWRLAQRALWLSRLRLSVHVVETPDEVPVTADLVVLATGYRHAAPHLGDLVDRGDDGAPRAARASNLWLLGVGGTLRTIARDAERLAARISDDGA